MIRQREEPLDNLTSKKFKMNRKASLADLPPEIVLNVLSFLSVKECEAVSGAAPAWLQPLLHRSIYGRTVLYLNYRDDPLVLRNKLCQMLFKYVDHAGLANLTNSHAYPDRFVLAYKFGRSQYEANEHDPFLGDFYRVFLDSEHRFFAKCSRFELSVDLQNRPYDFGTVSVVDKLIHSPALAHNLSYLNLDRFQRLPDHSLASLENILDFSTCSHLHTISLTSNGLTSFSKLKLPECLVNLNLTNNKITTLPVGEDFLPPNLVKLNLSCNNLTSLYGVQFPESLQYLDIQLNSITKLGNFSLPSGLLVLIACGNNFYFGDDDIVQFPQQLTYLNLLQNPYLNNINALKFHDNLKNIFLDAIFANGLNSSTITYI